MGPSHVAQLFGKEVLCLGNRCFIHTNIQGGGGYLQHQFLDFMA